MRGAFWLLTLLVLLAAPLWADDTSAVKRAFSDYTVALIRRNAQAAVGLVDQASLAYYESLRQRALSLKRSQLERQPMIDEIAILQLRHLFSGEQLEAMNGRQLLASSVEKGCISSSLENIPVGWVRFPRPGYALVALQGKQIRYDFALRKEQGVWKFALAELCKRQNLRLERAYRQEENLTARDLLELLESEDGRKPDPRILDSPRREAR